MTNNTLTKYSCLTEDELLTVVGAVNLPTDLEVELAARLSNLMNYVDDLEQRDHELERALAVYGVAI